ncbi:MAG: hypothetical protein NVS9B4_17010 [Candidatus Acidiferrum sp.]
MTTIHRDWLLAVGVSLLVALAIVWPFFRLGNASGHDFQFHVASWLDAAGQWKEGIIFPRWTEQANHGFGEPRFIFYPPLSWALGASLSFLIPWKYVPPAFIVLVQTLAGINAYFLTRRFFSLRPALFAGACFAANFYALLIVYLRSDFAELLALAFFPLLLLAALQNGGISEDATGRLGSAVEPVAALAYRDSASPAIVFFSVVFALVWLCNAPAGVMASYGMAALFAWMALAKRSWWPLARGATALALGFGLAAFYLLPAAYERSWVNIAQALSDGLIPAQNFLYSTIDDPQHNFFNSIASTGAIGMMLIPALCAVAIYPRMAKAREHKEVGRALLFLTTVGALLMLRFTSFLWNILPELRFVQFPWRWMAILAVPGAFFVAMVVAKARYGWSLALIILAFSGGSATWLARHAWWDKQDISALQQAMVAESGFDGADEYDPVGDDHYNLPANSPRVQVLSAASSDFDGDDADVAGDAPLAAKIHISRWTAEEKRIAVSSPGPVRVALRLLNYPAWLAEVNGQTVAPQRREEFNQMILPVPRGVSHIRVRFKRTWDRTAGMIVSFLCWVFTLLIWLLRTRSAARGVAAT